MEIKLSSQPRHEQDSNLTRFSINAMSVHNMLNDFKTFIMRGNVLDLAVGIIIGAAFSKIVTSFVADILTPVLSLAAGNIDLSSYFIALNGQKYATLDEAKKAGAATMNLGLFGNAVIDFVIIGFVIFMLVRFVQKMKSQPATLAPNTKDCPFCKTAIALAAVRCPACTSPLSGT